MKQRLFSAPLCYLSLAAAALLLYTLGPAGATPASQFSQDRPHLSKVPSRMLIPGTQDVMLIIELSDPGVAERLGGSESTGQISKGRVSGGVYRSLDLASPQVAAYRGQIEKKQEALKNRILELSGAQVIGSAEVVMNAVFARVHASDYSSIRRLPGVKKVYFSHPRHLLLDQAAIIQNAQGLWSAAGGQSQAGQGIKIGLVDSGIDIMNPMFIDNTLTAPTGYPKADNSADLTYTNSKVIVARNYVTSQYGYARQSVQTAVDEQGHGTFVAGCAAGKQVSAPLATISGMAPRAYLGNYKVFGDPNTNSGASDTAIVQAIEDAVNDGMDIISLSLGSLDYLPPSQDPEYTALENALKAGRVVTVAAGNDGPLPQSISSPATIPDVIAVGSVSNSRTFLAALHVTAPAPVPSNLTSIGYLPGDGPLVSANISSTGIIDVASLDGSGLACSSLASGSLSAKIALIERGTCTFAAKVGNAAAAGARAVVVYNNVSPGLVSMSQLAGTTIPAVMISNTDGTALKQFVDASSGAAQVAIDSSSTLQAVPATPRVVSSFSAVGPGTDFSIKPDLVAVGESVYSSAVTAATSPNAVISDPSRFAVSSGTSFSTPMVAGAAAGLRQLFPTLGPQAIKSLLTTTAGHSVTIDGTNPANLMQAGAGLLNMGAAASAGAVFSPTGLDFGVQSYTGSLSLTATLTIQNISSASDQYTLGTVPVVGGAGIFVNPTATGSVAPGSTATVSVTIQVAAPASAGFQGFITVQSATTSATYRVPYWAGLYTPDSTRVLKVLQGAASGSYSSLSAALAAANPGNIIEIEDSGTYSVGSGGLVITTNNQGLPLHGITIRAAAGQTPVIDGTSLSNSSSPADIRIVGLENVLLQGLTINGGYTGIQLTQASAAIPLSVTIDHCTISNSAGDTGAIGVLVDGGGTVNITKSTVNGSEGTGIVGGLFADGTQLTLLGTTVQGNGNDGLDVWGANVDILNSTLSSNHGAGMYLANCTGTVEGNTLGQNHSFPIQGQTSYGDGLQIADGNVTVRNNVFDTNDQAGIYLETGTGSGLGPGVQILRNTMRKNGLYGIYSNPSPSAVINSNLIEDNAGGIRLTGGTSALLLNNIIVRSTDATIGSGIEVASGSNARVTNNTIYQNAIYGVSFTSGTVSVVNSIISGNAGGDLKGVATDSVQSSLVSGTPNFTNPVADDFSLPTGSPAVDAGSNTASDLPFLDYYGRLRVASGGFAAGQGTVDEGAVESNSSYPLVFPLMVNGSEPVLGGAYTTGIAVMNPTTGAAQVKFAANSTSGNLLAGTNPASRSLGAAAQIPILAFQLFGFDPSSADLGSVLATSNSTVAGFFLIFDPTFNHFSTGVNVSGQTWKDVLFLRHESDSAGSTWYVINNPGANAANITARLYSTAGQSVGSSQTASIPPLGQQILNFNSTTLSSGYVRLQSDRPVTGLELTGNASSPSAIGAASPGSEAQLFFPHFAVGGNFTTQIGIVNSSTAQAILTLSAYDDNGNLLGAPYVATLPAGGQLLQSVSDLFGIAATNQVKTGYILALGDQPGVMGFTNFTYNDGIHNSTAAVPADSVPRQDLLFSHVAHGVNAGSGVPYQTGIALLNPFGTSLGYTISVYDGSGALVLQETNQIGPHQKVSKYLSHSTAGDGFFTQPITLGSGHVEVTTDYGLLGFELFFTEDYSQLASVPAQQESN